jgi:hypothetical protein
LFLKGYVRAVLQGGSAFFPALSVPSKGKGKVKVEIKVDFILVSAMKACGGVEV